VEQPHEVDLAVMPAAASMQVFQLSIFQRPMLVVILQHAVLMYTIATAITISQNPSDITGCKTQATATYLSLPLQFLVHLVPPPNGKLALTILLIQILP
jgi:hypothetical protein